MTTPMPEDQPLFDLPGQARAFQEAAAEPERAHRAAFAALQEQNKERMARLLASGRVLHPLRLLDMKINVLSAILCDAEQQLAFQYACEQQLAAMLAEAEREAVRATFSPDGQPPVGPSGLILPA